MRQMRRGGVLILCLIMVLCSNTSVFATDVTINPGESWNSYLGRVYATRKAEFDELREKNKDNEVPADEIWTGNSVQPTEDKDGDGLLDVHTAAQLRWALDNKKSLELMNDVDLGGRNGVNWSPVADPGNITIEGNGHTIYNLYVNSGTNSGMIATIARGNTGFKMQNLRFRYCYVQASGTHAGTAVGWMLEGKMTQVSVEDSVVNGASHVGGIVSGWNGEAYSNLSNFYVYMDQCHVRNVTTCGTSCIGSFVGPVSGYKITNSYSIDSYDISTASHSGGFVSCPGDCWVENCFTNVKLYCKEDGGVFYGIGHYANHFENCFAAGVVEGTANVGGFFGRDESYTDTCINCYSTSMVGMQNTANNMGGFYGGATGSTRMQNCYSAGEVGTTQSKPGASGSTLGGIGGNNATASCFNNCYYDKQTSGMGEYAIGTTTHSALGNVTGYLTGQMIGDAMKEEFGADGTWVYQNGMYPQLSVFTNPDESFGNETDKAIAKAYSAASVCTALLQPSNLGKTQEELANFGTADYDTVRNISVLFPLTNDSLAGYPSDGGFSISWESRPGYLCTIGDMAGTPVITLDEKTYEVTNFAPGVGWTDVSISTGITNPQNGEEIVGQRFLRLVPTTVISLANATSGVDQYIYVNKTGDERLTETSYDHRDSVAFTLGSASEIDSGNIKIAPYPVDDETFGYDENGEVVGVDLASNVGGKVVVAVYKLNKETGKYEDQDIVNNEELQQLLLKQRDAKEEDLGVYRLEYRWYKSGNLSGGCIVNSKTLTVREALTLSYEWNHPDHQGDSLIQKDNYPYIVGQTVKEAEGQSLPADPEMKGYTFMGWSTNKNADPDKFTAFTEETALKDDTVAYAIWKIRTYKVDTTVTGQGTIQKIGSSVYKDTTTVTWTPDEGHHVKCVMVDGVIRDDLLEAGEYSFSNIDADHKVEVFFEEDSEEDDDDPPADKYVHISTSTEGLGTIDDSKTIKEGSGYTVKWEAADGWTVDKVLIDGLEVASLKDAGQVSFDDSSVNHTVHVVYVPADGSKPDESKPYYDIVTGISGGEGTITATGRVQEGTEDYTVTWKAENGYRVVSVTVNGESRPDLLKDGVLVLESVDQDYDIQVTLKKKVPLIIDIPNDDDDDDDEDNPNNKPGGDDDNPGDQPGDDDNPNDDNDKPGDDDDDNPGDKPGNDDDDPDNDHPSDKPGSDKPGSDKKDPDVNVDTNGDGKPDINLDVDGDGEPDLNIDTDGDGIPDLNIDTNGDGIADINIDTNGDGKADKNIDKDYKARYDQDNAAWNYPKTGDESSLALWITLLGTAVLALGTLILSRLRSKA